MGMLGSGFGRALGAGGAAVAGLANRYIEQDLHDQKAQFLAELQRQTANNIRQDTAKFDDERAPLLRERMIADTVARGGAEDSVLTNRAGNATLNEALRGKQAGDVMSTAQAAAAAQPITSATEIAASNAKSAGTRGERMADKMAEAEATREATKAAAKDKDYLASMTAVTLADPRVAAQIAASRASAASAYANAEQSREQTKGTKLANADKERLGTLYDDLTSTLYDDKLDDAARAKAMGKINTQIQAIKAKNGQGAARDTEIDTQTVTEEKINPDGTTTKTTRKEVRKAGQGGGDKPSEENAHAQAKAAIAAGASIEAVNKRLLERGYGALSDDKKPASTNPPTRRDPISGQALSEREWDRKFGRGDFRKLPDDGRPSLKAW